MGILWPFVILRRVHVKRQSRIGHGTFDARQRPKFALIDAAGNPANQVRYFNDGRWPAYADGGGSSLELRDPNADNSNPGAWAASDETAKSSWQTYRYRAVAQTVVGPELWSDFVLGLLGEGECLIDDITVVQSPDTSPVQLIGNGDFENGLSGWRVLGDHRHSRVEVDPANSANHVSLGGASPLSPTIFLEPKPQQTGTVMPRAGLCRVAALDYSKAPENPFLSAFATRHNQRL
jgi:hypothetical protein